MARPEMTRSAVERLLDGLGEQGAREVLGSAGSRSAQQELERVIAKRLAIRLLDERAPRWQIRDRLVARGINWRTAYRVIDAALGAPVTCSANQGPGLANGLPRLGSSQLMEHEMNDRITAQYDALLQQRQRIDVEAAKRAAERAEAASQANMQAIRDAARAGEPLNPETQQERHSQLATEARRCRMRAVEAAQEAARLDREIGRLGAMLKSPELIKQAEARFEASVGLVSAAQGAVRDAEAALARVDDLIRAEELAYGQSRSDAAAQLLAAVKTGADTSQICAANREHLATLEIARAGAEQELQAARAALAAAQAQLNSSRHDIDSAKADRAALEHEMALEAYVKSLAAHMAAHARARRGLAGFEDPRIKASELAQRLTGA